MARRTGPAQPRPAAATALRLAVLAALCGCARAALTIDGYLAPLNVSAPGTWSSSSLYAPLFPSLVQSSSKPYPFQPGVVNTSAWNVTSVGGALQGSAFPTSNGLYAPSQGLGYSNASVVLDWNLLVAANIIAGSPQFPTVGLTSKANTSYGNAQDVWDALIWEFAGAFNEAPLSIVAAARLLALLNVVMYETVLLHVDASRSAVDPFNNDGSCPARVAAVNASASCPRFVALKDLGNSIAPLAASYAAHYTLSTLYPTKAGTGGSTLTNIRFDNVLKNHQQWFNLQWSKAENNPGGYAAAAANKTVTLACQNVGTMVAQAVLSARSADGVALWTPLSLSLNAPLSVSPLSGPAGSYTLTANNNGSNLSAQVAVNVSGSLAKPSAAATPDLNLVPSSEVVNITNTFPSNPLPLSAAALALLVAGGVSGGVPIPSVYGNVTGGAAHGWARTAAQVFDNAISEALYDIAPWGSYTPGSPPGVPAYSLAPQLAAASGFAVSPQAAAAAWAASAAGAPLAAPPAQPLAGDAQAALTVAASSASYNQSAQATQRAFFWRGGAGSYGLSGTFSAIAAQALNGANATYGLLQTAQLFAQLHSAIADAQAAAWTLKQAHLTPRPETVVGASAAPGWRPLLNNPPYPAFPSAHASMCSAAVAVLQSFFQGDAIPTPTGTLRYVSTDSWQLGSVKVATQTPGTSAFPSANFTYSILPNSTNTITSRAWTNFSQIAADCGQSRVDGGVQFSSSVAAGASLGAAVAVDVLAAFPMWASTAPGTVGAAMPAVWNYFAGVGGVGGSGYGGVPSPASSAAPASAPTVLALLLLTTFAALLV